MSRRPLAPLTLLGLLAAAPAVAQPPQVAPPPRSKPTAGVRVDLRLDNVTVRCDGPGTMTTATPPCCPAQTTTTPVRVMMAGPPRPTPALPPVAMERIEYHYAPAPPHVVCPPPACPQPACPPGVPADTWRTMVGAFGEMLNGPCPAPYPPPPVRAAPAMPCPAPVVLAQPCPTALPVATVSYVEPAMPGPVMPAVAVARPHPLPVGTWYREVGPVRMLLAVKDGTLSLTTTMTAEVEGKAITQGLLVTADCYPTRDGGLVGVVTGADLVLDGDLPADKLGEVTKVLGDVGKLQAALNSKPFALSCRVVDGCLMVSNVRLAVPKLEGGGFDGLEDGALIAGRYKPAGAGGPPRQKAVKVGGEARCDVTLPSPHHLQHPPQSFAAEPAFPLAREVAAQVVMVEPCPVAPEPREVVKAAACEHACPAAVRIAGVSAGAGLGGPTVRNPFPCPDKSQRMTVADVIQLSKVGLGDEVIVTQLRVTGSTFVLSIPDLVELKQAGVSNAVILEMQTGEVGGPYHLTPERIHGGVSYSSDPNVRMQQLLYQSDELREIGREWRRFWFNDQPSHLTPERIHGGIILNTTPAAGEPVFSYGFDPDLARRGR